MATGAALAGDPTRGNMLAAMLDGRASTAPSLLSAAPSACGHLAKLLRAKLVGVTPKGGHRYYRLALAEI
jgi:hypothetical protein